MKNLTLLLCLTLLCPLVRADQTNIAEDDAGQEAYNGGFDSGKNGGTGFAEWKMTTEGNDENRHSGFFGATDSILQSFRISGKFPLNFLLLTGFRGLLAI